MSHWNECSENILWQKWIEKYPEYVVHQQTVVENTGCETTEQQFPNELEEKKCELIPVDTNLTVCDATSEGLHDSDEQTYIEQCSSRDPVINLNLVHSSSNENIVKLCAEQEYINVISVEQLADPVISLDFQNSTDDNTKSFTDDNTKSCEVQECNNVMSVVEQCTLADPVIGLDFENSTDDNTKSCEVQECNNVMSVVEQCTLADPVIDLDFENSTDDNTKSCEVQECNNVMSVVEQCTLADPIVSNMDGLNSTEDDSASCEKQYSIEGESELSYDEQWAQLWEHHYNEVYWECYDQFIKENRIHLNYDDSLAIEDSGCVTDSTGADNLPKFNVVESKYVDYIVNLHEADDSTKLNDELVSSNGADNLPELVDADDVIDLREARDMLQLKDNDEIINLHKVVDLDCLNESDDKSNLSDPNKSKLSDQNSHCNDENEPNENSNHDSQAVLSIKYGVEESHDEPSGICNIYDIRVHKCNHDFGCSEPVDGNNKKKRSKG